MLTEYRRYDVGRAALCHAWRFPEMFKHLGRFAATHPWTICIAWLLAGAAVALMAPATCPA